MLAIYQVTEYGHQTVFLNQYTTGVDVYHWMAAALPTAIKNGGNLTAALAEVRNEGKFYKELPAKAHPLRYLDAEEAAYAAQRVDHRVTIDVDRGVMAIEHGASRNHYIDERPIPDQILCPLKMARDTPAIRLKDLVLLGLPPANVYLVAKHSDVGNIPACGLRDLTEKGREAFADLLSARVDSIQPGAYGVELVMTDILPTRLEEFDRAQAAMLQAEPHLGLFRVDSYDPVCPAEALQAVRDFLYFERDTTQIWPWFLSAEEMLFDERTLREIGAALHSDPEHGYDTDEIYQALAKKFGVNPALEQELGQTMAP